MRKKKYEQVQWLDSNFRFLARVSARQDNPPFVRLDLAVPTHAQTSAHGPSGEISQDNLFIPIQEVLLLRPYHPANALLVANPHLYEVAVRVDNFWSASESGGNSGRPVRRGTVDVSGDVESLKRLRGEKDRRFTSKQAGRSATDASGVRGIAHELRGGIKLRRVHRNELSTLATFPSVWVCVDYSETHVLHCHAHPACALRSGRDAATVNISTCLHREGLVLERQFDNTHDAAQAIGVVCNDGSGLVGYVPREVAACLAPAMDAGVASVGGGGVYSQTDVANGGDPHHRVWFPVHIRDDGAAAAASSSGTTEHHVLQAGLRAISWWVVGA
jgi:hypothetical protein